MTPNTCTLRTSAILQSFTSGINYQQLFICENLKPRNACLIRLFVKFNIFTLAPPEDELRRSLTKEIISRLGITSLSAGEVEA